MFPVESSTNDPAIDDPTLARLVALVEQEAKELRAVLPDALERQWDASPVPRPRNDTTRKASGIRRDPTADTALDPRRLAVRDTVIRAQRVLTDAAIALRGTRRAVERAVARFDGNEGGSTT